MTHSRPARTLFEWCSHSVNVLWGANCFNTTTFLLDRWAGLFKVVYPCLYDMSWRHLTVSMNPEFLAKFTLVGNAAIVLIKWFYGESTLCTSPRLHFKLNAIHGHAIWQHYSPSPLKVKIEKCRCQIARFTGGPCISAWDGANYTPNNGHVPTFQLSAFIFLPCLLLTFLFKWLLVEKALCYRFRLHEWCKLLFSHWAANA